MKRSELLKEIEKVIREDISMGGMGYSMIAADVLDLIERMGMLPPERVRYTDCPNGNTLCAEECSYEDEDAE